MQSESLLGVVQVLREGDGGRNVHHLQVALDRNGFNPDVEDQRWWQFGSSTLDCVYTFQVTSWQVEDMK